MTALLPASSTRAPEPININFTLPAIQRIHSQMRLSGAPARGPHHAQPAQCCRPRPAKSHLPPKKLVATTISRQLFCGPTISWANEPFSFSASAPTSSSSFFASFVSQIFHHPPSIPDSNWGHTRFQHTVAHQQSSDSISASSQCS